MRETACTEMREALAERARGTSPANAALDRHLAQCPGCRASLAALEQVLALRQRLRTELTADAESAGLDRLRPAIAREAQRARRRTGESSRRWLGWFALAPLAATAAFALFLAWPSTDDATVVRAIRTRGEVLIREPAGEVASLDEVARALRAGTRLEPGVLGNVASVGSESFEEGRLEHAQYTRPPVFRGRKVPDVLLSGDHARIARWRRAMSLKTTRDRRPDLFAKLALSEVDRELLAELDAEGDSHAQQDP